MKHVKFRIHKILKSLPDEIRKYLPVFDKS